MSANKDVVARVRHRLRPGRAKALHTRARGFLKTAMAHRCVGGKSDGQAIMAQVESGVTWSKPTHVPLARAHWVRVGVGVRVRVRVRVRVG